LIGIYDLDGNLTDQWNVENPGRQAMRPDGSLATFSDDRVVSVDDGEVSELVTEELTDGRGLAVDEGGNIYVAQAGALQQVRVFSPTGEMEQAVGKTGGRPAKGAYDRSGMYQPGGIDVDARGRLWVAETAGSPKRISVWDTENGENLDEYFGGSAYFAYGEIDPARPDEILTQNVLWEIDWDTYQTRPKTTVWRQTAPI
jgi:sugar lactone lactonase YvrE